MTELPAGWVEGRLEELVEVLDSVRVPLNADERKRRITGKGAKALFPYYGATGQVGYVDDFLFDEPLILLGEDGVPFLDPIRPKAHRIVGKCWVNNHAHVLRARDGVADARYLTGFLNSFDYRDFVTGSTRLKLTQGAMNSIPVRVAPLPEQKRIADKLDAVLARVETCRERLDRVPLILKRFRQAVLAAATSGKLTEEWREECGFVGSISASWSQTKIKDVGRVQLGRQRAPKFHSGSNMRPYLRVQNVFEDRLDLSDVMEMDFPKSDYEKYKLHVGDILLNEGQSPELLGRPAMFRGEIADICFTNTLIRFQANPTVKPPFALLVFRHYMHSGRFRTEGTITTNIAHLGAGRFAEIEFPLPPLNEQTEIVRRVEALVAFADRLEARYNTARAHVERITPALLAKAFRGELVPQDSNDEPASVLLKRIHTKDTVQSKTKRNQQSSFPGWVKEAV